MNRFKVGDKVRVKDWESVRDFCSLPNIGPSEGIVVDIKDGNLSIVPACSTKPNCCFIFNADIADIFELVAPADPKREFLERLQSLLREFDVFLIAHSPAKSVSAYLGDSEVPFASLGKEQNIGCGVVITADNIMDFNKE